MGSLGMKNSPENGPSPLNCQQQGTMSYGDDAPQKWSACSRSDLQAHYNQVLAVGQKWCLPPADRSLDCGGNCGSDETSAGGSGGTKPVNRTW